MIYVRYDVYKHARNAAWNCLIKYKINSLPVRLKTITDHLGILVVSNSSAAVLAPSDRGRTIKIGTQWYIVVDEYDRPDTRRFTIAHELGHIILGHAMEKGFARSYHFIYKPETETEADVFAARLLCPSVVLRALNIRSPEEIMTACHVSYSCAVNRAQRMEELYRRDKFLVSPLEREVLKNFQEFIERHRE